MTRKRHTGARKLGLSDSERVVHAALLADGPMTVAALAIVTQLARSTVEFALKGLLTQGGALRAGWAPAPTPGSVVPMLWQARRLGPGRPAPAQARRRPCLGCDRAFPSEGAHNRLCGACRGQASGLPRQYQEACG